MSSVFISGIVGTGDYAVPEEDADLTAAENGLSTLLAGVAGLSYNELIAFVLTTGDAIPQRTLGALLTVVEYFGEECPDETETASMTAAIEAALLADADISAIGGQDVKLNLVSASSSLWVRNSTEGFLYPNTSTDDVVIGPDAQILISDSATIPPLNVTERAVEPSAPEVGDIYLDDGTNTLSGSPGWRRCVSTSPDVWEDIGGGGGGIFEADIVNNEIQPVTAEAQRGFVVGSQSMDDSGPGSDARMFFDRDNGGTFRSGQVAGAQWDSANRGDASAAFGTNNVASGDESFVWGEQNVASGSRASAGGHYTVASGANSSASGYYTTASGRTCHAEGYGSSTVGGDYGAHAEGGYTVASGNYSHAEGNSSTASGDASHAEGFSTEATGDFAHAEGSNTEAFGYASHAAGQESVARLAYSRATAGNSFTAFGDGQNIEVNCGISTLNATPKDLVLGYNLSASNIEMQANSIWGFSIRVAAKSSEADGNSLFAIFEGLLHYDGTNITLIGAASPLAPRFQVNTAGAAAWNVEIQNVAANNDVVIKVTGAAALTVRWVAQIQATEIIQA